MRGERAIILGLSLTGLGASASRGAAPGPRRAARQPVAEVAAYRVSLESLAQSWEGVQELADTAGPGEEAGPRPAATETQQLRLRLKASGADPQAGLALDGFETEFRAETDRGQRLAPQVRAAQVGDDAAHALVHTAAPPGRMDSLKSLSGHLRVYERGERVRLTLQAREGAEARHPSGLAARLSRLHRNGGSTAGTLQVEWPAAASLRNEEGLAFSMTNEAPGFRAQYRMRGLVDPPAASTAPPQVGTAEQPPAGLRRSRIDVNLGVGTGPSTVSVEVVLRTGRLTRHPFTIRDLPLPLALERGRVAAAGGLLRPAPAIVASQRVLVNGRPAGPGTLEIGVSAASSSGWGPWRWQRASTDEEGTAQVALPGPGRFRIWRRWSPQDPEQTVSYRAARWRAERVEVVARAGRGLALPPLAAAGVDAPTTEPAQSRVARVRFGEAQLVVRAVRVRQRAEGSLFYDRVPSPWLEVNGSAQVHVSVSGATDAARAGLVAIVLHPISAGEDSSGGGAHNFALGFVQQGRTVELPVNCPRPSPGLAAVREIVGELVAHADARAGTVLLPLGERPELEWEGARFRVQQQKVQSGPLYRLEMVAPERGSFALGEFLGRPELLDEGRRPLAARLAGIAHDVGDSPRAVALRFEGAVDAAAFLRVPLLLRSGEPQRKPFRLRNIPLLPGP